MSYLLGVDVGSTNLKAVLFGTDGAVAAKADVPTECVHPDGEHPEWAIWDPQQIWSGIAHSIRKAVSGIDRDLLCDPMPSGTLLGAVHRAAAEATGLKPGTPVALGGHDYSCGCLPTGAFKPGVVLDVLGTWEMVVATMDKPVLSGDVQRMGVLIDSHVARDKWAAMGATVAADMLEWFRREFGREEKHRARASGRSDWDHLMETASQAPVGSHGIFFLPHMSGSHCPVPDHLSAGSFVGLRNIGTRGDMLRAVIEGLNYQFVQIVRTFESNIGVPDDRIVAIGGPTENEFWMQNKAYMIGRPIDVPEIDEAVPLGAALLAGIGTGVYRDEADAFERVFRAGRTYHCDRETHEKYGELCIRFEELYPALRQFYRGTPREKDDV